MATGSGPLGDNIRPTVSDVTPGANLNVNADAIAGALSGAARFADTLVTNKLEGMARKKGAQEGAEQAQRQAAGENLHNLHAPFMIGSVGEARRAAAQEAYLAGVKTDIDAREGQLRRDHAFDPESYEKAGREVVSGFIQNTPPEYAVAVERYAQGRVGQGFEQIADARAKKDIQEQSQVIQTRETSVEQSLLDLVAAKGGEYTAEYDDKFNEWNDLQTAKAANPLFAYTPEQAALKREALLDKVQGIMVSRDVVAAYAANGEGPAGRLAALRHLSDFIEDPTYAGIPAGKKLRMAQEARKNLDIVYADDLEAQRIEAQKEREAAQDRRDRVGELRLNIMTGGATREEIMNADVNDDEKASLLRSMEARQASAAAAARSAASADRLAQALNYKGFADDAAAGLLTDGQIADAAHAGLLSQGQARTLAARRDKVLAPMVRTMMSPVRDAAKAPGMSIRGTAEPMMRAEQQALRWAQVNPNATKDEQFKAGELLVKEFFGSAKPPPPGAAGGGQGAAMSDKSQKLNALKLRKGITPQEREKLRRDIMDGK